MFGNWIGLQPSFGEIAVLVEWNNLEFVFVFWLVYVCLHMNSALQL